MALVRYRFRNAVGYQEVTNTEDLNRMFPSWSGNYNDDFHPFSVSGAAYQLDDFTWDSAASKYVNSNPQTVQVGEGSTNYYKLYNDRAVGLYSWSVVNYGTWYDSYDNFRVAKAWAPTQPDPTSSGWFFELEEGTYESGKVYYVEDTAGMGDMSPGFYYVDIVEDSVEVNVNIGGTWQKAKVWAKAGGSWKEVKDVFVKKENNWWRIN